MLRKLLLVASFLITGTVLFAQTGSVKIKLVDKANQEPIPFANIIVEQNGSKVSGTQTNLDGEAAFTALPPGKYDIKATYVGYQPLVKTGFIISVDKSSTVKFELSSGQELGPVIVESYVVPLIDPDTKTSTTISRDDFQRMARKDVNTVVSSAAGVYQADAGGKLNVRGSRDDATAYYVDGVRVVGDNLGIGQLGVEQITAITGGIPAQYGDATGAIISITTRGVQPKFFASLQGESSQYLDAFGHNLVGFSVGAPIYSVRDTAGHKKNVVGFIISGNYQYDKDPSPSAIGTYKVNDDVLKSLEDKPLRKSPTGIGNLRNAEFITMNDLEKIKYRNNVAANGVDINGKLQFKLSENTDITVGGQYGYGNKHDFTAEYALFNSQNNPNRVRNTYNVNARLTQRFNTKNESEKEKTNALITNAVYTLQASYGKDKTVLQDDNHQDRLFNYGYIGKFDQIKGKWFPGAGYTNFVYDDIKKAYVQQGQFADSLIKFTPSDLNQTGANYTSQFYELNNGPVHNESEIQQGLGLLNGDRPTNVYSIFYNTGRQYGGYQVDNNDNFRVTTSFSANVKNHNVQIGFEYDQRIQRSYFIAPIDLWTLMRQITNSHLSQLDTANPIRVTGIGTYDYIYYNQKYDGASQHQFDKSLRQKLGMAVNSTDIINTDAYDPSFYSMDMFSADDLLTLGPNKVAYYGYDYTGKKLSSNPSFDSYFTEKDANGNFKRQLGAIQPIYVAGYIQDQFEIKDLKFRLGLRIDRYDANTKVMKDKYSLYETRTVGEVSGLGEHPSNIGNDYVVYVDDPKTPSKIIGYRNGDTWYNPQGAEVNDPTSLLSKNSGISKLYPYLVDQTAVPAITSKGFKDYVPQINVMPRIAFAFPISDLAQFNANYDITTQRPPLGTTIATAADYLFWQNGQNGSFANTNLQPQRTTSYEVGYKQVLNERKNSALTISAFYKELRNLIQQRTIVQAYPSQYVTYDNIDFATVKGFSIAYDLRRTHNLQLSVNYTLQFADGTGSGPDEAVNIVAAGLPNLRTLIPLGYDQRHQINASVDYRFSGGTEYDGPVWIRHKGSDKEKVAKLLEEVGFNLSVHAGSGVPFSRQSIVTETAGAALGVPQRGSLVGTINGSNLPWTYRLDLKVDKRLKITWAAEHDGKAAKVGDLDVYISFLNLLNTMNILKVYKYTGNAQDDGFVSSVVGQQLVAQQTSPTSFTDLYSAKVNNNTGYYSIPRTIRIGFTLNF